MYKVEICAKKKPPRTQNNITPVPPSACNTLQHQDARTFEIPPSGTPVLLNSAFVPLSL
jgi:hypothetical protein